MSRILAVVVLAPLMLLGCPARAVRLNEPSGTTDDPLAESSFREAAAVFEQRSWQDAQSRFEAFRRDFPRDPLAADARLFLGRIALETGHLDQAREHFRALLSGSSTVLAEQATFFDGLALARGGNHREAIRALRPFAGRMIDHEDAELLYETLAAASIQIRDHVGALRWFDAVAQVTTSDAKRRAAEAQCEQIAAGPLSRDQAEQAMQTLPRTGVAWPIVALRRASDALDSGDFAKADEMLTWLTEAVGPHDARVRELTDAIADRRNVDPRVIGAVLPLSGRAREIGADVYKGLLTASEALQEGVPEGQRVRLVVRDDAGDPERAAAAVDDLVQTEHVIAIIGSIEGGTAEAAARHAEAYGVPILLLSPREGLTSIGQNVFRSYVTNHAEASLLAAEAARQEIDDVAIIYPDIAYGRALRDEFVAQTVARGARVVAEVRYAPGARTFTDALAALRSASPQAIFLPCPAADLRLLAPALAAAGYWSAPHGTRAASPPGTRNVQFLATSVGVDAETLRGASRYLQGAVVSSSFTTADSASVASDFVARYRARFGQEPSFHSAFAHDAWQLIRASIEHGARSRAALRDFLSQRTDAQGATSMRGFGPDREPIGPARLMRIQGAAVAPLR